MIIAWHVTEKRATWPCRFLGVRLGPQLEDDDVRCAEQPDMDVVWVEYARVE